MTSGNVSDEPIAYRDEDALERLAGIADLFLRPRPADRDPHRRLGGAGGAGGRAGGVRTPAPLARLCAGEPGAAGRDARAAPRVRRRAQEHVLRGQGRARVGRPSHRRPPELRDAPIVHRAASRTSSGCSRSRPQVVVHDLHPEYLSTKYALERDGRRARSASSTTTPIWPRAWPSTASRGRAVGAIFDGTGLRHRRDDLGRRAAVRRPRRASSGSGSLLRGAAARRRARRSGSRGGWRARGWLRAPRAPRRAFRRSRTLAAHVDGAAWRQVGRLASTGSRRRVTTQHGPAVRRGRRAVRHARERQLRGPGGDRARGGLRLRREAAAYPIAVGRTDARDRSAGDDPGGRSRCPSGCRRRRDRRAVPRGGGRGYGRGVHACCAADRGTELVVLSGGRVPEPDAARGRWRGLSGSRTARADPERLPVNDGGISYGQAAIAARLLAGEAER